MCTQHIEEEFEGEALTFQNEKAAFQEAYILVQFQWPKLVLSPFLFESCQMCYAHSTLNLAFANV